MARAEISGGPKKNIRGSINTFRRLMKFLFASYPVHLLVVLACIFLNVFANVQGNLFIQTLIDSYILPLTRQVSAGQAADFGPLLAAMARVAGFYGIGIVSVLVQGLVMARVTQGMMDKVRRMLFTHMEDLPIRYFDTHGHGDIMSVYTNDVDTLRQMISQAIPQMVSSAITIVATLISMIILSVPLTLVTLSMVALMLFVTGKLTGQSGRYYGAQQRDIARVNAHIEEYMSGQKVVQVFNHEKEAIDRFVELNDQLFHSADNANKFANIIMPINGQLGNVSYVLSAVIGGLLAMRGLAGMTLGRLASFLTFNRSFTMPINQVSMQMNFIVMGMAGATRIFAMLDEEKERDEGYVTLVNAREDENGNPAESTERTGRWAWRHYHRDEGTTTYTWQKGHVTFEKVNFAYLPGKQVLYDIDMFAEKGQKLAFVGATGAGKTTILNLLNRFYDIEDGKIRIDGINVNKIKKDDLRHSMGYVLQDTHLFTGSIADNIRFGKLDASMEEVIAAARLANADGFIRRLPEGYDTVISGDGSNLSQGQRQLLAIARAAIYNPPVLVLDEATSSIDTHTEKLVQNGLDALMKGRTSFVIAHRLSTIQNADCIMVMEQGHIIERGSHEELIQQHGKYYQLYTGKIVND